MNKLLFLAAEWFVEQWGLANSGLVLLDATIQGDLFSSSVQEGPILEFIEKNFRNSTKKPKIVAALTIVPCLSERFPIASVFDYFNALSYIKMKVPRISDCTMMSMMI